MPRVHLKQNQKKKKTYSLVTHTNFSSSLQRYTDSERETERELKMDKKLIVRSLYRSLCSRSYHVAAVSHTLLRHHHHHLASPSRSLFSLSSPSPNRLLSGTILFPIPNLLPINPKTHFSLFINFYIFFAEIANFKN